MSEQHELRDSQHPCQQNTGLEQSQEAGDHFYSDGQHDDVLGTIRMAGPLTTFDVFSFIVNKMVGTGIFTAPPVVLALTADRRIALSLWAIGFLYSIITCAQPFRCLRSVIVDCFSMFIYLSFAAVLPYSTGELVYVRDSLGETLFQEDWLN